MNELVKWLGNRDMSVRQLGINLKMSHSHIAKVLRGESPVTWEFAARVAQHMGLDPVEAFVMAGLLKLKQGAGLGGDAQTGPEKEVTTESEIIREALGVGE